MVTLRCLINGGGGGGQNKWGGWRFLLNLINGEGVKINRDVGGISKNPLISVMNEKMDIYV